MPDPFLLSALISGGSRVLGGLFGGGGSERGLTSEQQALLKHLQQKRAGGIPGYMKADISDPFAQLGKLIKQKYARQPGSSGLESSVMRRQVTAPQSRALSRAGTQWEMGIDQQIASLLGGTGTYKQGTDWGGVAILGD